MSVGGLPRWYYAKEYTCQCRRHKGLTQGFDPWVGMIPWSKKWHPSPVFLSGKFHGQRSLAGYNSWGRKELDMTEQLNNNNVI